MFKNYFKFTLRNLLKNRLYTAINVAGLALGIACALIIFLIIKFELSFDTYHRDAERIYRLVRATNEYGSIQYTPGVPHPLPEALRGDFPEFERVTIVDANFTPFVYSVTRQDGAAAKFKDEPNVVFVDPDYFKIFSYQWLSGDPGQALANPQSAVISRGLAKTMFGDENPIGKLITCDNRFDVQITGVVVGPPQNSDLQFTLFIRYDPRERGNDNWRNTSSATQCFVKLSPGLAAGQFFGRFNAFIEKYMKAEDAQRINLSLQPLTEQHFDTRYGDSFENPVPKVTFVALGLIGLFLVITACINFVNLNTALAVNRAREVGVRKVLGSSMLRLVLHFLGETALITLLAIFAALTIAEIALAQLQPLLGYKLSLNLSNDFSTPGYLLFLFIIVTLLAGFYPAFNLASFTPAEAIRSNRLTSRYGKGLLLRKGLVVLQFAISQTLIICAIVIASQMDYFRSADMGFVKEAIVEIDMPTRNQPRLDRFKSLLLRNSAIRQVSFSNTGTASNNIWTSNYSLKDSAEFKEGRGQMKFVDQDFIDTYQLKLLAGNGFAGSDSLEYFIVNHTFAEKSGYGSNPEALLGKYLKTWRIETPIGGVAQDFNTTSLHNRVEPVIMLVSNRYWQAGVKIDMQNAQSALTAMEDAWDTVYPEYVFDYAFLDESIVKFYENEQNTARLMNIFTLIAIIIGCLGLFGLVSYMAAQRTKEIGIRKVLGAKVSHVLALLSKDFLKLVLLANIFAWPAAWFAMNLWLQDFAYRIEIGWWVFALSGSLALLIALLTVSWQAIRAALSNPVEALRYE